MSNSERDDRIATQTLWEIYLKSGQRQSGSQASGNKAPRNTSKEPRSAQSPNISSAPSRPPGMGRIVTSGDFQNARLSSEGSGLLHRELQSKGSNKGQRGQASERVTVIVQKPSSPKDEAKQQSTPGEGAPNPSPEIPVPPSAFAVLKGTGNSARSSADLSLFSGTAQPVKDGSGDDTGTQSDEPADQQIEGRESPRPAKRQKMSRSVSINTILQRVGSREGPLVDVAGTAPLTVHDMVATPLASKSTGQGVQMGEPLKTGGSQFGDSLVRPSGPSLPPRKSSDQSTMDVHKQLALRDSSNTVETVAKEGEEGPAISRAMSVERELHPAKGTTSAPSGPSKDTDAAPQQGQQATAAQKGAEEAHKLVIWSGKVKHRLKTADGASTVELFNVSVMVPEKLMEQMPPTLFVSALAGRANVKLGKHFVAQCSLSDLEERQKQKVTALAVMRLVAICELQHCTLTLVPFTDSKQGLRMVGFMIADD